MTDIKFLAFFFFQAPGGFLIVRGQQTDDLPARRLGNHFHRSPTGLAKNIAQFQASLRARQNPRTSMDRNSLSRFEVPQEAHQTVSYDPAHEVTFLLLLLLLLLFLLLLLLFLFERASQ